MDTQTPQSTPELQPHKNFLARHILAEVLSLVIVIAVGVGGYYYQNSKQAAVFVPVPHKEIVDPTAGWLTYINRENAFEFKYPREWTLANTTTDMTGIVWVNFGLVQTGSSKNTLYVKIFPDQKAYDVEENIIKNNATATLATTADGESVNYYGNFLDIPTAMIAKEDLYLEIGDPSHESALKNILPTFKFLDSVFCGGIAGFPCPATGFDCVSQGNYPDAGTICTVKKTDPKGSSAGGKPSGESCIQVITTAKNLTTKEVRDFATPCDVPQGWEIITGRPTQ